MVSSMYCRGTCIWDILVVALLKYIAATDHPLIDAQITNSQLTTKQQNQSLRQLSLIQFTGYSLSAPTGSNLLTYSQEKTNLLDVRAGVNYTLVTLHASSNLGSNNTLVRIKLMLTSASDDPDCIGSTHEAPNVVPLFGPPTPLDGATPARTPIYSYQNGWLTPRFPYSGVFEACYYSGALWRHVTGQFTVKGANTNMARFWCVGSTFVNCKMLISGLGIQTSWTLSINSLSTMCGSGSSIAQVFDRAISIATTTATQENLHTLGNKRNDTKGTFRVCYCPGFSLDGVSSMCTRSGDFQQMVGLLYVTRVTSAQRLYPKLRFDAVVNCGGDTVGGCPLSRDMRIKIVNDNAQNDLPLFDSSSGCRTAQQATNHYAPSNCLTATDCSLEPSVVSATVPQWNNIRISGEVENHNQKPLKFDVCFCKESCSTPANWFKVDDITTNQVQVLPSPMIANSPTTLQLYAPFGGFKLTGDVQTREMKLLFDPEGKVTYEDCYQDPQDGRAIFGHVCYSTTDCQSPSSSTHGASASHSFRDVRVRFTGMYSVCYCDENCNQKTYWTFVKWYLVAGPSSNHVWSFSRGIIFDVTVTGLGLQTTNRLRISPISSVCGEASATAVSTVSVSATAPTQKGDLSGTGVFSLAYAYDGMLVTFGAAHQLNVSDYVSLTRVTSLQCPYCADLVNSRPHKVIRVPSTHTLVIPIVYPEQTWPDHLTNNAQWIQSNKLVFGNLNGSAPGSYRVCWGNNTPSSAVDFVGNVGTLTIFEPPIFQASVHLTSVHADVVAPIVIAFQTRIDPKYASVTGEMQFKVHFRDILRLTPGFNVPYGSAILMADAKQSVCGMIFKELWSSESDGFPMPKGCFYDSNARYFNFLFSAKNGLKGGGHYQIVLDAQAKLATGQVAHSQGVVQLWSMDDVGKDPFGVIELAPADIDKTVMTGASGTHPSLHSVNGVTIIHTSAVQEVPYTGYWRVQLQVRARAGAPINKNDLLRIFLWPLTQWNIQQSCVASCQGMQTNVNGVISTLRCASPICIPENTVTTPSAVGEKRNIMRLTFGDMDSITDTTMHTVMLSGMTLPTGGFFPTAWGAEIRSPDGSNPSYMVTTGTLIFVKPSSVASIVTHPDDGNQSPFRGDQGNLLYVRLVLGASIWSPAGLAAGSGGFALRLPIGYVCVQALPTPTTLNVLAASHPQGRGDIGLDSNADGFWIYSGETCTYTLRINGVVYAGSAIYVKVQANNPVFALQRDSASNTWTVQLHSRVAPMSGVSSTTQHGLVSPFVTTGTYFARNVPTLGRLTEATLVPALFGGGESRNFLSIYFKTEQGTVLTAPHLQLTLPAGFGFLPQCIVEPLPTYQYASMSSQRTGVTVPTKQLYITHCQASSAGTSVLLNQATMKVSQNVKLQALATYGFRIQVFNAKQYSSAQRNSFRLTTLSSSLNAIDASYYTVRFLSTDGDGVGTSWGIYHYPMPSGFFVVSLDNMLPFSETGVQTTIIIFPLRVPFDSRVAVSWRIIAPHGYEWDFLTAQFQYRTTDILGVTADLPIAQIPTPPALPPKNILDFNGNFAGAWDRTATYGFNCKIRVPDSTPRSTVNSFFVEFGYNTHVANDRLAAASYEAPQVRALINTLVDYQYTNLAGQLNRILVRFQSITTLIVGGGLQLETPTGFIFETRCVVLSNPMRISPTQDLASAASAVCASTVPYTTNKPLITISVVSGQVRPALYEFMLDCKNPTVAAAPSTMTWLLYAYTSVGSRITADLTASFLGFPTETPMRSGELVTAVNYGLTQRDDHPSQRSYVVLALELNALPSTAIRSFSLIVKAPLGFSFAPLCEIIVGNDVFGPNHVYPFGYEVFAPSATIDGCVGDRSTANITVKSGLLNLRKYVFRLEVFNPASAPQYNRWSISFAGESSMPFNGYRLWAFTEVNVAASHGARSSSVEETQNTVTIRFRPTNAITSAGFLAITAPLGFRIATVCVVQVSRLNPLFQPISTVPHTTCQGAPQPTNTAEVHITNANTQIIALEPHQITIKVVNPLVIPIDPGKWRIQSYSTKTADYRYLLDVGEGTSFNLTEVFNTLQVIYPFIGPLDPYLLLTFRVILPNAADLGDVLTIEGPTGYDFAVTTTSAQQALLFRACRGYGSTSPSGLTTPKCLLGKIRFTFQVTGIPLDPFQQLTPLIEFQAQTVYPTRTLQTSQNVFHGEHTRGTTLLSSKTVNGQMVTPRLQGLAIARQDTMIAVGSLSRIQVSFSPSQDAAAISMTTRGIVPQDPHAKYGFQQATITGTVQLQPIASISVAQRDNTTMTVATTLTEGFSYVLTIANILNPVKTGKALWTLTTYAQPTVASANFTTVLDYSVDFVGPQTITRIAIDIASTTLANSFFDTDGTELLVAFRSYPDGISAGQYLILYAPYAYILVDRTFKPGNGFPLVSGSVYVRGVRPGDPAGIWTGRAYVIQIVTAISANQLIQFSCRVNTPRTPPDLTLFATDYSKTWRLIASQDPLGTTPTASNDGLFPGFTLKASFGTSSITPEPNGVTPRKHVVTTVTINPQTTLRSLTLGGSITVRLTSPIGFVFDSGCLAVTPNPVFLECTGAGRIAVLPVRNAQLPSGVTSAQLRLTNAGITPADNTWTLESYVDVPTAQIRQTTVLPQQQTIVTGYLIRDLIQAIIGANTQRADVTRVFVWFLATTFLDVSASIELHAPTTYSLRCTPRIEYISLPAGTCRLEKGVTAQGTNDYHHYLVLTLTLAGQVVYPNTAYEFAVPAINPGVNPNPNFWGLVMRNTRQEVVDATMTLPGYSLTDYQFVVDALLASSTRASIVNFVRLTISFGKQLPAATIQHITFVAPSTTKILCPQFVDLTGGGNIQKMLPTDGSYPGATQGDHSCQYQHTLTVHLDRTKPVLAGSYNLRIGVLNPAFRAPRDFWAVQLLGPDTMVPSSPVNTTNSSQTANVTLVIAPGGGWRTATPLLEISVPGFGISTAWFGAVPLAVPVAANFAIRQYYLAEVLLVYIFVRSF